MTPTTFAILICRGVGLCFAVAGCTGLLPYLLFDPLFRPVRPGPITTFDGYASPHLLWSSPFGYQIDSMALHLIVGVLLLLFSRRVGRWLAFRLPVA